MTRKRNGLLSARDLKKIKQEQAKEEKSDGTATEKPSEIPEQRKNAERKGKGR